MISCPAILKCSLVRPIMLTALLLFSRLRAVATSDSVTGSIGKHSSLHRFSIASISASTSCL